MDRGVRAALRSAASLHRQSTSWIRAGEPAFPVTAVLTRNATQLAPANQKSATKSDESGSGKAELISKAMRAYLDRARTQKKFFDEKTAEFELGRRHLAKIMGKDPEEFGQEDIDKAIVYLFPSGLFAPPARPFMRHPKRIFHRAKAAEFGWDGRPFHPFFYTGKPRFNKILYDGIEVLQGLSSSPPPRDHEAALEAVKSFVNGTKWKTKVDLSKELLEKLTDKDYERFVLLGDRILEHPRAFNGTKFLEPFREPIGDLVSVRKSTEAGVDPETGIRFAVGSGSRKCSKAEVILREGTGKVDINGQDIEFFENIQERLQILTPFSFLGRVNEFDIEAEVQGPSNAYSSSAGALRIAISRALTAFSTPTEVEHMRLAGLLTEDPRVRERKIYGQKGARAKFTWKRR